MKFVLSLALLFVLVSIGFTSGLEISSEFDSNVVVRDFNNPVEFELKVTDAVPGTYNLYTLADMVIDPRQTFVIGDADLKEGVFVKLFVMSPNSNLDVEGLYRFTYTLNHRDVEKVDDKFIVNLVNLEDILIISSDSISPEDSNPRFYIENKENVALKNVTALFSSTLFETERTFDLRPYEKKYFNLEIDNELLTTTKAGVYIIEATFETVNGEKKLDGNLFLGEKKGIVTNEDFSGLIIRSQIISKINAGNVLEQVEITMERNIFSRLFTSFNIEPTEVTRKGLTVEYSWSKSRLGPSESYTIKAKTNYLFPLLILIVGILVIIGLKRFGETKLELSKEVHHVKTKKGEFALKIKISAVAKKDVENVTVTDRVPAIVKIYRKFGTLKPDKIDPETRKLQWNIGDLNAGEERIFSYIVYSKVGIVGKFSLPGAVACFEKGGDIHEVISNKVFFLSDQVRG
jgi:hypothetical protein